MPASCTLLVDNGSLQPAAIKKLRELATEFSRRLGETVEPVSMLHSDKVPPIEIDERPAEILEPALRRRLSAGMMSFKIIPLFVGPSHAVTTGLRELAARLKKEYPALSVRLAPWLGKDERLADLLAHHVRAVRAEDFAADKNVRVALVDHGSPVQAVTEVRDRLARVIGERLGTTVSAVAPCSMERRPDERYAFNEPLLENLLISPGWREVTVIVAMLFLLPGRHAGLAGDVAALCVQAQAKAPKLKIRMTPLLADHPDIIELLLAVEKQAEVIV